MGQRKILPDCVVADPHDDMSRLIPAVVAHTPPPAIGWPNLLFDERAVVFKTG